MRPANPTTSRRATFQFVSSEEGSTFRCSLDGAAYAACSSPKVYTGLSYATHTFRVRATDAAGNVDATAATWTWRIRRSTAAAAKARRLAKAKAMAKAKANARARSQR